MPLLVSSGISLEIWIKNSPRVSSGIPLGIALGVPLKIPLKHPSSIPPGVSARISPKFLPGDLPEISLRRPSGVSSGTSQHTIAYIEDTE